VALLGTSWGTHWGLDGNPIVNMQLRGFKNLKIFPRPIAGGFSIKENKT